MRILKWVVAVVVLLVAGVGMLLKGLFS